MIRHPKQVLAVLVGLSFLSSVHRNIVPAVVPLMEADFGLQHASSGGLETLYLLGFLLASPVFGALGDRFSRKLILGVGVTLWTVMTLASGLAGSFGSLAVSRALVGVGQAAVATVGPTIIDDIAPPQKNKRWLALFFAAFPAGAACGFLVGGNLGRQYDWSTPFLITAIPGLLLIALAFALRDPERALTAKGEKHTDSLRRILRAPLYLPTVVGMSAFLFGLGAVAFWAPSFLVQRFEMDLAQASSAIGGLIVFGGIGGTALGGVWADRRHKKRGDKADPRDDLRYCAIALTIAAPASLLSLLAPSAPLCLAAFFVCGFALFFTASPTSAVLMAVVPAEVRASALAVCIFAMHFFGDLWSPLAVGSIADHLTIQWALMAAPIAFAVCAVCWWAAVKSGRGSRGSTDPR